MSRVMVREGKKANGPLMRAVDKWYAWRESNARPLVPETSALSPELQARIEKPFYHERG